MLGTSPSHQPAPGPSLRWTSSLAQQPNSSTGSTRGMWQRARPPPTLNSQRSATAASGSRSPPTCQLCRNCSAAASSARSSRWSGPPGPLRAHARGSLGHARPPSPARVPKTTRSLALHVLSTQTGACGGAPAHGRRFENIDEIGIDRPPDPTSRRLDADGQCHPPWGSSACLGA